MRRQSWRRAWHHVDRWRVAVFWVDETFFSLAGGAPKDTRPVLSAEGQDRIPSLLTPHLRCSSAVRLCSIRYPSLQPAAGRASSSGFLLPCAVCYRDLSHTRACIQNHDVGFPSEASYLDAPFLRSRPLLGVFLIYRNPLAVIAIAYAMFQVFRLLKTSDAGRAHSALVIFLMLSVIFGFI